MNLELFFETHSPIQIIRYFKEIRYSKGVFFLERIYPELRRVPLGNIRRKISYFLIKLINPKTTLKKIPLEKLRKYNWLSNQEALIRVKENESKIRNKALVSNLICFFEDANISNFFLNKYVAIISEKIMFESLSKDFKENSKKDSLICIPHSNTINLFFEGSWHIDKEKNGICFNRILVLITNLVYYLISICSPFIFIFLNIFRFKIKVIQKKYKIKSPIIWGLDRSNKDFINSLDDSFLYGENIQFGDVIHIHDFKKWKINENLLGKTKDFCLTKGCGYDDSRQYNISLQFIVSLIKKFPKILAIFRNVNLLRTNNSDLMDVFIVLLTAFEQEKELLNIDYKVEFVRDDYNRKHVVRTVVNKKHGITSIGTQHHIHLMDYPSLAFIYLDKYLTYNESTSYSFKPYWREGMVIKTGRPSVDRIIKLSKDFKALEQTKAKLNDLLKSNSRLILITVPSGRKKNSTNRWDELIKGIRETLTSGEEYFFLLKFRDNNYIQEYENCRRLANLANESKRVKLVEDRFSTHELILASDLVICGGSSSVLIESLAVNRKCHCFKFVGNEEFYYPNFGNDLIIRTGKDFSKIVKAHLNQKEHEIDVHWDRLEDSVNYYRDGRNIHRIQSVFYESI